MGKTKVIRIPSPARRTTVLYLSSLALYMGVYLGTAWLAYRRGGTTYSVGPILALFILSPLLMIVLAFTEQRPLPAVIEAVAFGLGLVTAILFAVVFAGTGDVRSNLLPALLVVAAFVLIRLAGIWLVRTWFRELVIQTGTLCWTCGYDLTGNTSGLCPECGRRITRST